MLYQSSISPSTKVLVVDDERTTRMAITEALNQLGYAAQAVESGDKAIQSLQQDEYHVVLLDLEMPGVSGVEVLIAAEDVAPHTAFIVLTAHASTDTAIVALRTGAIDYLRKPSSLQHIAAAVERAAMKQQEHQRQQKAVNLLEQAMSTLHKPEADVTTTALHENFLQVGNIIIDSQKQTAVYQQQPLELTPIEYRLLYHFAQHPDTVLTYAQLGKASHDMDMDEAEARSLLRIHVYRLSRKLGDKETTPLQNLRGRGVILYSDLNIQI